MLTSQLAEAFGPDRLLETRRGEQPEALLVSLQTGRRGAVTHVLETSALGVHHDGAVASIAAKKVPADAANDADSKEAVVAGRVCLRRGGEGQQLRGRRVRRRREKINKGDGEGEKGAGWVGGCVRLGGLYGRKGT